MLTKKTTLPINRAVTGASGRSRREKHRWEREAEDADEGNDHQDQKRVVGAEEFFPEEERHDGLAADEQDEDGDQGEAARNAVPRSISFQGFFELRSIRTTSG